MIIIDISIFIGRFHPLIVHLPIGILFLAFLLNLIFLKKTDHPVYKSIGTIILIGAIFAIPAAIAGLLLAESGGYSEDELSLHQYFGLALIIFSFGVWWLRRKTQNVNLQLTMLITLIVLLMITGHLGGNLTHGSTYLTAYAPARIKSMLTNQSESNLDRDLSSMNIDSVVVFQNLIAPILQTKCISCHQESKMQGGLNLATAEGIQKGGESGLLIEEGNPFNSLLFHRVTLESRNPKFMPPKGEPLSFNEITMLEWWIENGASLDKKVLDFSINDRLKKSVKDLYRIDLNPVPYIEKLKVAPLDRSKISDLRSNGWRANTLSANSDLLDISFVGKGSISRDQLYVLSELKEHIVWLDLSGAGLQDDHMEVVANLINLVRLRLDNNPLTDLGISPLSQLSNLESLSLYNTQIGDTGIEVLKNLPAIKSVYVWQTQVSDAGMESLKNTKPNMEVVRGFNF